MPKRQPNKTRSPGSLDLFCGIGGLTIGLERAGFRSLGGVDHWEDAARTFESNLNVPCMIADLASVGVDEIEESLGFSRDEVDLIAGGPPCQGFSTVGKREHSDPRNRLWEHFYEIVGSIRPAYLLIENVEGLVVMQGGRVRQSIERAFREIGYHIASRVLVSADYGVPQLRKRVVFLGWLDGLAPAPFPAPLPKDHVSVRDAIFDLPPLEPGQKAERHTQSPFTEYQRARRGRKSLLHNHEAANHPDHLVEILSHIPDGGNRRSIPDQLQPKSGFHNSYARLASWKPAIAVTSNMRKPSSARATHPEQHRGLTVREGLRLQSFDDNFVVLGSRTSQYLQVGNAVPPLLGEALGRTLLRAFEQNAPADIQAARASTPKEVSESESQLELSFGGSA